MNKEQFRLKLCELLVTLVNDMRVVVSDVDAEYVLNRITDIVYSDYENNQNKPNINGIEKPFRHLAYGDFDIRYFNVINIMRCIRNTTYGIYPQQIVR
jgi:hypothetical protein